MAILLQPMGDIVIQTRKRALKGIPWQLSARRWHVRSQGNQSIFLKKLEEGNLKNYYIHLFLFLYFYIIYFHSRHPDVVVGYGPAIEKAMQRSKNKGSPPVPQSFDEAHDSLTNCAVLRLEPIMKCQIIIVLSFFILIHYRKTIDGNNEFYHGRVSNESSTAFIFLNLAILSALSTATTIHTDGTFNNTPALFYQLFVVQVVKFGKVSTYYFTKGLDQLYL